MSENRWKFREMLWNNKLCYDYDYGIEFSNPLLRQFDTTPPRVTPQSAFNINTILSQINTSLPMGMKHLEEPLSLPLPPPSSMGMTHYKRLCYKNKQKNWRTEVQVHTTETFTTKAGKTMQVEQQRYIWIHYGLGSALWMAQSCEQQNEQERRRKKV